MKLLITIARVMLQAVGIGIKAVQVQWRLLLTELRDVNHVGVLIYCLPGSDCLDGIYEWIKWFHISTIRYFMSTIPSQ